MGKLVLLVFVSALALGAYNVTHDRDVFSLPSLSAGDLKNTVRDTVRDTVGDTVRNGVRSAARETSAEVKERATAGVHTAVNRAEETVSSAALTSKIKAKMTLDDLVKAADIDVDTDDGVVTLTGTVGSKDEQKRAVRIATETAGVTKVVSHLKIR